VRDEVAVAEAEVAAAVVVTVVVEVAVEVGATAKGEKGDTFGLSMASARVDKDCCTGDGAGTGTGTVAVRDNSSGICARTRHIAAWKLAEEWAPYSAASDFLMQIQAKYRALDAASFTKRISGELGVGFR
jgi:hypothetical protein